MKKISKNKKKITWLLGHPLKRYKLIENEKEGTDWFDVKIRLIF